MHVMMSKQNRIRAFIWGLDIEGKWTKQQSKQSGFSLVQVDMNIGGRRANQYRR